jgi:hypothetical protein
VKTLNSGIPTSTGRDYNQEFRKLLLRHPQIGKPPLFGLLLRAEKIVGEKIWLVEEAIWEAIKNLGAQVSDEEKEHLKKLVAKLKEEHTAEVLAVARSFNSESSESEMQIVISNAIKTSNIKVEEPKEKMPIKYEGTVKEESELEGQMKGADIFQDWVNTIETKKGKTYDKSRRI